MKIENYILLLLKLVFGERGLNRDLFDFYDEDD